MTVRILHPEAFALLAVVPVVWLVARRTLVDASRAQVALMASLRSLIVVLLALALAGIDVRRETSAPTAVVVACDVSASMGDAALDHARSLVREISRRAAGPVTLVAFDDSPRAVDVAQAPSPVQWRTQPGAAGPHETAATDVVSALRFARAAVPANAPARIVLITDGRETEGRMLDEAASFGGPRRLAVLAAPAPETPEVLLASLDVPPHPTPGAAVDAQLRVASTGPADARLEIFLDGFRLGDPMPLALAAGDNPVSVSVRLPKSGVHQLSARVSSDRDTHAENNRVSRVVSLAGELRVLIVEEREEDARFLARALREAGLEVDVRVSSGFPVDLAELDRYACVVLSDVPATSLLPSQMTMLRRWVEDLGGGFIMTGGESSFGLGGYRRTPVEEILPVRLDTEKKREEPTLAMALVLDKSGSMEGEKVQLAKEASLATLEMMGPDDLVGVVTFDTEAYLVSPMQRATNRAALAETLAGVRAGGGTNMFQALELAGRELRRVEARVKHVLLLTDGKTSEGDYAGLVRRLAGEGVTVSAVAVGAEADVRLLQDVARWGRGRFYFTRDVTSIPQIFARETAVASRSAVVEEPFRPRVVRDAEVLRGLDFAEAPYLLGYVSTKPKLLAEVLLASDRAEPVLARTHAGLGHTVAFTSDVKNRWAAEWVSWPGFAKFWAQVVRDTMRPRPSGEADARIEFHRGLATITVDAADASGRPRNGLAVEAAVTSPGGGALRVAPAQDAPGRYRAEFPAPREGTYFAGVRLEGKGDRRLNDVRVPVTLSSGAGEVVSTGAVKPPPPEFAALEPDVKMLSELAARAYGEFFDAGAWAEGSPLADAARRLAAPIPHTVAVTQALAPTLLVAALVAFFVDLALRRVDVRTLRRSRKGGGT